MRAHFTRTRMNEADKSLTARLIQALGKSYTVEGEIGRGGMGVVFNARDERLKREVAVKVLPPELAFREEIRLRFLREAETAARLSHPHIVPIHSVGEGPDGLVYFVMAYVDGESVAAKLKRRGSLPAEESRRIMQETADALGAAHALGIIHRDVKPDNILLEGSRGRVVVTDFGIAKALSSTTGPATLTATGVAIGTPHYMSPEQAAGDREIDGRSDIYSLGVVAYQMLTGELPFHAPTVPGILMKHITERAPLITDRRPDLPEDLAACVMRCLEKDPEDRWPTADALRRALESRSATMYKPRGAVPAARSRAERLPPARPLPSLPGAADRRGREQGGAAPRGPARGHVGGVWPPGRGHPAGAERSQGDPPHHGAGAEVGEAVVAGRRGDDRRAPEPGGRPRAGAAHHEWGCGRRRPGPAPREARSDQAATGERRARAAARSPRAAAPDAHRPAHPAPADRRPDRVVRARHADRAVRPAAAPVGRRGGGAGRPDARDATGPRLVARRRSRHRRRWGDPRGPGRAAARLEGAQLAHRLREVFRLGQDEVFEIGRVADERIGGGHALHRGVEPGEGLVGHARRDIGAVAPRQRVFVRNEDLVRLPDRRGDRLPIHRREATQVDHLDARTVALLELLRRDQRPLHHGAVRHDGQVPPFPHDPGLAERDHGVRARVRGLVVRLAVEVLVLEEQHRVVAADRGAEQAVGVERGARAQDAESGDGREHDRAGLGVVDRAALQVAAVGDPHDEGAAERVVRAPP